MSSERVRWLLLAVAAGVLVAHALTYNFVTDDAYISFVYSRNLAEHGELSFNLGHPVEGYTNFLWTVLIALGMLLGVAPEVSSRALGIACALATLYFAFRLTERALGRASVWTAVPPLLLACSSGFACWTSGGLETQLFTLLVVIALDGVVDAVQRPRAIIRAGLALALSAMTRPEGLLVAGVLGIVHLTTLFSTYATYKKWPGRRYDLVAAIGFLALWAPWFYWRYTYYGYLWPNTYYVKAAGPWSDPKLATEMYVNGVHYLWVWLLQTRLLYVAPVAVLGMLVGRARTPRFALGLACVLLTATYLPYTITVGGDFMGLHRFIMPMFVVAAVCLTLGLEFVCGLPAVQRRWVALVLGLIPLGIAAAIFAGTEVERMGLSLLALLGIGVVTTALAGVPDNHRGRAAINIAVLLVGAFAFTQYRLTRESLVWGNFANDRGIDTPAFLIVYTEDRAAIGRAMAPCFKPDDFSIVGGAGAQPYFGRMQGIDVFGLVSERIAHEEPRIRARAGHTKFGSDELLASYDPTFVFSCYQLHGPPDPAHPIVLPCGGFWRARGYEQVTMHIPELRQSGEYYTFLVKKARDFQCPGLGR